MFNDMLRTQLLLKNIITPEDWDMMSDHIQYDFLYDNHFSELKDAELTTERINLATLVEPYVGRYYSNDYVRRNILRQTDADIIEQDTLIEKEIKDGTIQDPMAEPEIPAEVELGDPASAIQASKIPKDPTTPEPPETPAGGEI